MLAKLLLDERTENQRFFFNAKFHVLHGTVLLYHVNKLVKLKF